MKDHTDLIAEARETSGLIVGELLEALEEVLSRVGVLESTLKRVLGAAKALSDAAAPLNSKTADGVAAAAAVIETACRQASNRGG